MIIDKDYIFQGGEMVKYIQLYEYLKSIPPNQSTVPLSFSEIEKMIGSELPPSAKKYRPWWANEINGTHSQRLAWMNADWLVNNVNLFSGIVIFKRK